MNTFFEVLGITILVVLLISILFGLSLWVGNSLYRKACKETAQDMGLNWKYNIWIPCMVELDDNFIPLKQYLNIKNINN